jgi:hypothetical protein
MTASSEILKAPMPDNIVVERTGMGLTLSYKWFSFMHIFLALFCVVWDGFLIFWYNMALTSDAPLLFILFPIVHVAVGVVLTYSTIAGFVNKTTVTVSNGNISIYHGPLPWLGSKTIPAHTLTQLYIEKKVSRSSKGHSRVTYQLSAITTDNKKVKLISSVDSHETALYLEQEIESHLGIRDQRVVGETQK